MAEVPVAALVETADGKTLQVSKQGGGVGRLGCRYLLNSAGATDSSKSAQREKGVARQILEHVEEYKSAGAEGTGL